MPSKTLTVKILKHNERVVQENLSVITQAMHLLAILTEQGAFTDGRCQINCIGKTFCPPKQPSALQRRTGQVPA